MSKQSATIANFFTSHKKAWKRALVAVILLGCVAGIVIALVRGGKDEPIPPAETYRLDARTNEIGNLLVMYSSRRLRQDAWWGLQLKKRTILDMSQGRAVFYSKAAVPEETSNNPNPLLPVLHKGQVHYFGTTGNGSKKVVVEVPNPSFNAWVQRDVDGSYRNPHPTLACGSFFVEWEREEEGGQGAQPRTSFVLTGGEEEEETSNTIYQVVVGSSAESNQPKIVVGENTTITLATPRKDHCAVPIYAESTNSSVRIPLFCLVMGGGTGTNSDSTTLGTVEVAKLNRKASTTDNILASYFAPVPELAMLRPRRQFSSVAVHFSGQVARDYLTYVYVGGGVDGQGDPVREVERLGPFTYEFATRNIGRTAGVASWDWTGIAWETVGSLQETAGTNTHLFLAAPASLCAVGGAAGVVERLDFDLRKQAVSVGGSVNFAVDPSQNFLVPPSRNGTFLLQCSAEDFADNSGVGQEAHQMPEIPLDQGIAQRWSNQYPRDTLQVLTNYDFPYLMLRNLIHRQINEPEEKDFNASKGKELVDGEFYDMFVGVRYEVDRQPSASKFYRPNSTLDYTRTTNGYSAMNFLHEDMRDTSRQAAILQEHKLDRSPDGTTTLTDSTTTYTQFKPLNDDYSLLKTQLITHTPESILSKFLIEEDWKEGSTGNLERPMLARTSRFTFVMFGRRLPGSMFVLKQEKFEDDRNSQGPVYYIRDTVRKDDLDHFEDITEDWQSESTDLGDRYSGIQSILRYDNLVQEWEMPFLDPDNWNVVPETDRATLKKVFKREGTATVGKNGKGHECIYILGGDIDTGEIKANDVTGAGKENYGEYITKFADQSTTKSTNYYGPNPYSAPVKTVLLVYNVNLNQWSYHDVTSILGPRSKHAAAFVEMGEGKKCLAVYGGVESIAFENTERYLSHSRGWWQGKKGEYMSTTLPSSGENCLVFLDVTDETAGNIASYANFDKSFVEFRKLDLTINDLSTDFKGKFAYPAMVFNPSDDCLYIFPGMDYTAQMPDLTQVPPSDLTKLFERVGSSKEFIYKGVGPEYDNDAKTWKIFRFNVTDNTIETVTLAVQGDKVLYPTYGMQARLAPDGKNILLLQGVRYGDYQYSGANKLIMPNNSNCSTYCKSATNEYNRNHRYHYPDEDSGGSPTKLEDYPFNFWPMLERGGEAHISWSSWENGENQRQQFKILPRHDKSKKALLLLNTTGLTLEVLEESVKGTSSTVLGMG